MIKYSGDLLTHLLLRRDSIFPTGVRGGAEEGYNTAWRNAWFAFQT